jgi:hypothetical protein
LTSNYDIPFGYKNHWVVKDPNYLTPTPVLKIGNKDSSKEIKSPQNIAPLTKKILLLFKCS